ncbi:MAG: 6-bladed beta-propeller [Balneola sp.]
MSFFKLFFYFIFFLAIGFGCSLDKEGNDTSSNGGRPMETQHISLPEEYDSLKNVLAYPSDVAAPYEVSLIEETIYGSTEEKFLSDIAKFEVNDEGLVFIEARSEINVFNANGNYLTTLGRRGRGPGEFSNMTSLSPIIKSSGLYVYDDVLGRINIFDTQALEFSQTVLINRRQISKVDALAKTHVQMLVDITDGLFLFEFEDFRTEDIEKEIYRRYYLIDYQGEVVSDEVFNIPYKNPNNTKAYFFSPQKSFFPLSNGSDRQNKIVFDSKNNIYTSWTENFFIKVFDSQGQYQRSIFYPFQNSPLNENEIIETFKYDETVYQRAKNYKYPETWPAIDQFFVDDEDRIWVSTIIDDEQNYEWWILKNTGELISKFNWPGERLRRARRLRVQPIVRNGYFYIKETNPKTGDSHVASYKIILEKKD